MINKSAFRWTERKSEAEAFHSSKHTQVEVELGVWLKVGGGITPTIDLHSGEASNSATLGFHASEGLDPPIQQPSTSDLLKLTGKHTAAAALVCACVCVSTVQFSRVGKVLWTS